MAQYKQVPTQRVGTAFQDPAWRYNVIRYPAKYGFDCYLKEEHKQYPNEHPSHLRRLLPNGIVSKVQFTRPAFMRELLSVLPVEQSLYLQDLYARDFKRSGLKKIKCTNLQVKKDAEGKETTTNESVVEWDPEKLKHLQDEAARNIILHFSNVITIPEIDYVINFKASEKPTTFQNIGCFIFAGTDDTSIAKKFQISPSKITAMRQLFFDFSYFPSDRMARWTLLKQLLDQGIIEEIDFGKYKMIHEMGELGLNALAGYQNLTQQDKKSVEQFLASSVITETLELYMNIKSTKAAREYCHMITEFAKLKMLNYQVQKAEIENSSKLAATDTQGVIPMLENMVREFSLRDSAAPDYISIEDLKKT